MLTPCNPVPWTAPNLDPILRTHQIRATFLDHRESVFYHQNIPVFAPKGPIANSLRSRKFRQNNAKKLVYMIIYNHSYMTYANIFLCHVGSFYSTMPLFTTNPLAITPSHPAHREEQRVGAVGIQLLCHAFGGLRRVTHH